MKKLSEDQIQDMIGRKEKIRFAFIVAAFVAVVVNVFYFYWIYKFGREETFLLESVEIFNIILSLGISILIIEYLRNNVTDVSYFLWYMDSFLSSNRLWEYGKKPFMFVKHWRMYPNFDDLKDDVVELKRYNSKYSYWAMFSAIALLFVLLCNSVEVLFCGESARIVMVWTGDVTFLLFFISKCILALVLIFSLFMFFYYRDKIRALAEDPSKCKIKAADILDLV